MKKLIISFLTLCAACLFFSACQSARQTEVSVNAPPNSKATASNEQAGSAKSPENSPKPESAAKNETPKTNSGGEIENRCGWFSNPTPANMWLTDRDGEWTIGVQGGYQAEGTDNLPDFGDRWVKTNINYGYGCACLRVAVDRKEKRILKIVSATAKPIADCRNDKALREPSE